MTRTMVVAKSVLYHDGKVLILRRSGTDSRRPLEWDLPGGEVDAGEDFAAAAAREIKEETGLDVPAAELRLVFTRTDMYDFNVCRLFFVGQAGSTDVKLSFEHDQHRWLPLDEAVTTIKYEVHEQVLAYIRDHDLLT